MGDNTVTPDWAVSWLRELRGPDARPCEKCEAIADLIEELDAIALNATTDLVEAMEGWSEARDIIARQRAALEKISKLVDGGPFDLTDSPKSLATSVRTIIAEQRRRQDDD